MVFSSYTTNSRPNIRQPSAFDPDSIVAPDIGDAYSPTNPPLSNTPDFKKTVTPGLEAAYSEAAHTRNTAHPLDSSPSLAFNPTSISSSHQPDVVHDVYQPRMAQLAEQIDQQLKPRPMGKFRTIAAGLLSARAPALANVISGDYQRNRALQPLEQEYGLLSDIISKNRAQQTTDITNRLHSAQADYFEQKPELASQPKATPQEQAVQYYLTQIDPKTKKLYNPGSALQRVNQEAQDVKPAPANKQGLEYDPGTGIPISYTDENQQKYDVNDSNLPAAGKALVKNALGAHSQHVKESADAQARAAAATNQRQQQTFSRQDVTAHDKNYVQPAEAVEKSYEMLNNAYNEYKAAKAQGKELPTGAQSMLALSTHLSTTFGNVKGSRITKDMIQEHLHARSISDSALVAIQKLTNGDVLSPDQWEAFHDLIGNSRKLSWNAAVKQAKRKNIPVDFLPTDLQGLTGEETGGAASGAPPAGAKVRDYTTLQH